MTAEVTIMNKLGMSLAADSAVTSGREGVQKVYNSANKLFSLSRHHSIGFMVYGAASFMEVPWEVIIKSYRAELKDRTFDDVSDYFADFISFLNRDDRFKAEDIEEIIIHRTFSDLLKRIVRDVEEDVNSRKSEGEDVTDEKVTELLIMEVEKQTTTYAEMEKEFLEIEYAPFKEKFQHVISEIKQELIVYTVPDSLEEKLTRLAFEAVKKDFFSVGSTGLVIAGYGDKEIFPHLLEYRLEGFVFGNLKYKKLRERKITYTNDKQAGTASITAFAQREMVDSFMGGIEPNMEDAMFGIIDRVLGDYHEHIQKQLNIKFSTEQVRTMKKMGNELYESIKDSVEEYQQDQYVRPLLGIVRSLPKEELAEMAEALVNLTSFKKRLTRATESVGPPIDVAVITKGDGFVWIKRKNYYDPEINQPF
ncbi:hypothetical protein ERJ70_02975 [Sediminibacillus dalangtanensis]|uniref:LXG domain of WXG superfamily protein n=1 Tax=Sediminibacillus dalangtanensis TaxID=2729421 RepID=A0ABX7VNG4_9BACI|nr:hypothetical protein [Sediminibacillus dalangtanensis]QTM98369.1 hypothetical protein ERJ70_02975 [Sediminibacillus dalangtanensis]